MLVTGFPSAVFGTNVYVVAPDRRAECIIIDPGVEVGRGLDEIVREHGLKPVAVLLTHGHIDHTFSVFPVAGARDIPAYIHPADRELLSDPAKGLSAETVRMLQSSLFGEWQEPDDVQLLDDTTTVELAGLSLTVDHAPGHTPGSVMFRLSDVLFSGDVLFAGSIGRTDLPGGSHEQMLASLRDKVLTLPDHTVVLPGHGEQTTVERERANNPFLRALLTADQPTAPARGL